MYSDQPDGAAGIDTYILNTSPNTNNGTTVAMWVGEGNNTTNKIGRSLIKFDLSSIPSNANIISATLSLWPSDDFSDNDRTIKVYRLKVPFDEMQATWNERLTGVSWQSPGASGTDDRESVDIGSVQILADEPLDVEKQISLAPAQIQELVSGAFSNNGFIIVVDADPELNDRFNYRTSDAAAATKRPKLVIQYTVSSSTPTATFTPSQTPLPTDTETPTLSPTFTETPTPSATPGVSDTPSPTPTVTQIPPPQGPVTITYDYDPLYRLTAADYSTGDYYHYSYDAVGNRKTQESMIGGLLSTDAYNYDDANRLIDVDGVTHTWDDNGNLLSDGINTYTYDSANRLKTLTGLSVNANYAYNGLGDRLQETLNGNTTTFTMDLNMGLTQALSDGTNTYIYGLDRVAQTQSGTTEYFLGDALGSVRQMASNSGVVTYARAYNPYGVVTNTSGSSQSAYGYTGEFTDVNGLVYLRARYYTPGTGRFLTKDSWTGDVNNPITLNRWTYANANPILYADPTGHCDPLCIIAILIALGVISSGCTEQPSITPTIPAIPVADPSDCRNLNNWFVTELTEVGLDVHKRFDLFLKEVTPGGQADWREELRELFGDAIAFCRNATDCGFYDVSTPGNIAYGYLGAQVGISRETLHAFADAGEFSDEIRRLIGVSELPPGVDPNHIRLDGFDSPGDFNAIELGYDLWEQYGYGVTNDEFMKQLNGYYSVLEIRNPTVAYFTEHIPNYSSIGCGNNPPRQ